MSIVKENQITQTAYGEDEWKGVYTLGGASSLIALLGSLLDVVISFIPGWAATTPLPKTAVEWFAQFQQNWLLGLRNLDLLNVIVSTIMTPAFIALYAAHRRAFKAGAMLALILYCVGTAIFVANNVALPMLALAAKYAAATSEAHRAALAAAAEAMLARGAHGSFGVFPGFILPVIAGAIISFTMLRGGIFSKASAYLGLSGHLLLFIYFIFVTFIPEIKNMVLFFGMPGGIFCTVWIVLISIRFFQLRSPNHG